MSLADEFEAAIAGIQGLNPCFNAPLDEGTLNEIEAKTGFQLTEEFKNLEVYEWGIDSNKKAYELYRWLENDFYEDESYCQYIEREKLLEQLHSVISLFRNNELPEWADFYEKVVVHLNAGQLI